MNYFCCANEDPIVVVIIKINGRINYLNQGFLGSEVSSEIRGFIYSLKIVINFEVAIVLFLLNI